MVIQIDTRQKPLPHNNNIEHYFINHGIDVVKSKMLVGDYMIPCNGNVVVDTKQNMSELYTDLIGQHLRFANECKLAQKCGIKLNILVANDCGIKNIDDVINWKNPLQDKYEERKKEAVKIGGKIPLPPTKNETLIKIMRTMSERYGVEFLFCESEKTAETIVNLLT